MTWVAINRITVATPDEAQRLLEAFRHRSGRVDLAPGFESFEVWREEADSEVLVLTRWRRREDFQAWVDSPAFRAAHAHAHDAPGSGQGAVYEVAIGAGSAPRA
jgi:heme oxygenase (staphylobilin-producing)